MISGKLTGLRMTMNCADKRHHKTEREALDHLAGARKRNGGHGLKHLNVYECPCGEGWCVGRAWRSKREAETAQPAAPAPKQPTAGQLRRAEKRAAEKAAKLQLYADYTETLHICRMMVDREIARMEAAGLRPRKRTRALECSGPFANSYVEQCNALMATDQNSLEGFARR